MAKIKLTYFNAKGRAEIIRLILAQAGVEYEDCRFARDQWPEIKKGFRIIFENYILKDDLFRNPYGTSANSRV